MKKFIRYLYEYQNGRRVQNAGFIKAEESGSSAILQIYGKGFPAAGRSMEILLFYLMGNQVVGISMGMVKSSRPMFGYRLEYTPEDVGGEEIFRAIEGVIILSCVPGMEMGVGRISESAPVGAGQGCRWYAATWNDSTVAIEKMMRREEILRNAGEEKPERKTAGERMRGHEGEEEAGRNSSGEEAGRNVGEEDVRGKAEESRRKAEESRKNAEEAVGGGKVREPMPGGHEGKMLPGREMAEERMRGHESEEEVGRRVDEEAARENAAESLPGGQEGEMLPRRETLEERMKGHEGEEEAGRRSDEEATRENAAEALPGGHEREMLPRRETAEERMRGHESEEEAGRRDDEEATRENAAEALPGGQEGEMLPRRETFEEPMGGQEGEMLPGRKMVEEPMRGNAGEMVPRRRVDEKSLRQNSVKAMPAENTGEVPGGKDRGETALERGEEMCGREVALERGEKMRGRAALERGEEMRGREAALERGEEIHGREGEREERGNNRDEWSANRQRQSPSASMQAVSGEAPEEKIYKITRRDLAKLPRREWKLANNHFLMHGYRNYHHLISFKKDGYCWLGVPGIYHPREQQAASAFGFGQFMRQKAQEDDLSEEERDTSGEFGYWCRVVSALIQS